MLNVEEEEKLLDFLGFEVFTAVAMKSTIFWDITPCSPLKVDFQRTTRRYVPENSTPCTLKLLELYVLRAIK
jgi:hypothetical protein